MKRIAVNITKEDGELLSRFFVVVNDAMSFIDASNKIEDTISNKFDTEEI